MNRRDFGKIVTAGAALAVAPVTAKALTTQDVIGYRWEHAYTVSARSKSKLERAKEDAWALGYACGATWAAGKTWYNVPVYHRVPVVAK